MKRLKKKKKDLEDELQLINNAFSKEKEEVNKSLIKK